LHHSIPPLFSICIPAYNLQALFCQAIRSGLLQTYRDIEIVVSDNASTDGTEEAMAAFHDVRFKYTYLFD
jgi:glycosyltransferase involved in cell wall biosynthesis